jgi:hypothetical protein
MGAIYTRHIAVLDSKRLVEFYLLARAEWRRQSDAVMPMYSSERLDRVRKGRGFEL